MLLRIASDAASEMIIIHDINQLAWHCLGLTCARRLFHGDAKLFFMLLLSIRTSVEFAMSSQLSNIMPYYRHRRLLRLR